MTFKDITGDFICVDGWEIRKSENYYSMRHCPIATRKKARLYIKGLKVLFKLAKEKSFFERAGESYTGNTNTVESKYRKLCQGTSFQTIIEIGNGKNPIVQSYVDGSYTVSI